MCVYVNCFNKVQQLYYYLKQGKIILSLPNIEVLAEAAAAPQRRGAVLHVLETTVLGWIKQIKVRQ